MSWWHSRFWYLPIILVIAAGYICGTYLWFSCEYMGCFPFLVSNESRLILQLFGLGVIGGAMHCSVFFAKDYNVKVYGDKEMPTCLCFLGYLIQVIGGGITGVVLYVAVKAGVIAVLVGGSAIEINKFASWLIAFGGGYGTHHVKQFVNRFVKGTVTQNTQQTGKAEISPPLMKQN